VYPCLGFVPNTEPMHQHMAGTHLSPFLAVRISLYLSHTHMHTVPSCWCVEVCRCLTDCGGQTVWMHGAWSELTLPPSRYLLSPPLAVLCLTFGRWAGTLTCLRWATSQTCRRRSWPRLVPLPPPTGSLSLCVCGRYSVFPVMSLSLSHFSLSLYLSLCGPLTECSRVACGSTGRHAAPSGTSLSSHAIQVRKRERSQSERE
jgi:hypothetical protein